MAQVLLCCVLLCAALGAMASTERTALRKMDQHAQPSLTLRPAVLEKSMDDVVVSWYGAPKPNAKDMIALYCPADAAVDNFIGFKMVSDCPNWSLGNGQLVFQVANMRTACVFRYLSANVVGQHAVVATAKLGFVNEDEPTQGHLSLTQKPSEMRVMWVSATSSWTSPPQVSLGVKPGVYFSNFTGISYTYDIQAMCEAPANQTENFISPGQINDVLLFDLQPQTRYFYRYGNPLTGWSAEKSFLSAPGATKDMSVNVAIFGDLGVAIPFNTPVEQQPPARRTVELLLQDLAYEPDAHWSVLHIGDLSYARGFAFLWDYFFALIEPVATQVPYMVSVGNHEYNFWAQPFKPSWSNYVNDSGGECGVPYAQRFHMPEQDKAPRNAWYSYDFGPLHFTVYSGEHDFTQGSEQYNWLVNDLGSVDRSVTPWLIFTGHRPMYTSSNDLDEGPLRVHLQQELEPLLIRFKVDLAVWAHVHMYERTCPMVNFTCVERGQAPIHIVTGNAGNNWQAPWKEDGTGRQWYYDEPSWIEYRTDEFGYSRIRANASHLHFEHVQNQRHKVYDSFTLDARYPVDAYRTNVVDA